MLKDKLYEVAKNLEDVEELKQRIAFYLALVKSVDELDALADHLGNAEGLKYFFKVVCEHSDTVRSLAYRRIEHTQEAIYIKESAQLKYPF